MSGKKNEEYTPDPGTIEATYDEGASGFKYRDLKTPGDVRTEMVIMYKMARKKMIDTGDYSKYVMGLREINSVIRDTDIETRMKRLELLAGKKHAT